jgi:hypothetical protein
MPDQQRRIEAAHAFRDTLLMALTVVSFVAGCAQDDTSGGWTSVVDTVGSTVRVTNTPPGTDISPTWVGDEEMRVGTLEGEGPESFGLIRSIAVLDDGRFAVADAQAEEVRLFDREGHYLRTFGGEGQGPGELMGLQGVFVDHEGMLRVAEQTNARLSVFAPDTGYVRSFPLRLYSYGFRGPWAAAIDSTGRTMVASAGQYGEGRFWNMLRIYDPSMRQLDSIPYHEYTNDLEGGDPPGAWRIQFGNGFTYAPIPFFARPHQVVGPAGEFWTTAEGRSQLEVARWTPPGDTSLVLFSLRQPEPVTPAERDSAMAELLSGLARNLSNPPKLDPSRVPATKPPSNGISLDDGGRLWVRLTDQQSDTTLYDLFDRDGHHAETVALPFRVDAWIPPVVHGDMVWAVVTDESEVQYVVRARMRPVARSGV